MKNSKGFTLIELIAAITILGIIMLVAIPNILSVSIKSKNRTYLNDANKLVTLVKYRFESDANIEKPTSTGKCLKIKLSQLDQTELQKGPENGKYDKNNSFVVVKYDSTESTYKYYVQIKEVYDSTKKKGIPLTEYDEILDNNRNNSVIQQTGFIKFSDLSSEHVDGCTSWVSVIVN